MFSKLVLLLIMNYLDRRNSIYIGLGELVDLEGKVQLLIL
jgi:hypothetical protein